MYLYLYIHNKYTQYTLIYYLNKETFILDVINHDRSFDSTSTKHYVLLPNNTYLWQQGHYYQDHTLSRPPTPQTHLHRCLHCIEPDQRIQGCWQYEHRGCIMHSAALGTHTLGQKYVRMLFVDFSSAFNTVIPSRLTTKLRDMGINSSLCNWIMDFLTNRPQSAC